MASAKATINLNVSPDEVWQLIGGFGSLPDWLPNIPQSHLTEGGRIRHLRNADGEAVIERLEFYDLAARTYRYSILRSHFPITQCLATLSVTPASDGTGSQVEWSATFTPGGMSEERVQKLFQGIFTRGMESLASHYNTN